MIDRTGGGDVLIPSRRRRWTAVIVQIGVATALGVVGVAAAQNLGQRNQLPPGTPVQQFVVQRRQGGGGPGRGPGGAEQFKTAVPEHPLDVILGRPTNNSVTASILSYQDGEGYVSWWPATNSGSNRPRTVTRTWKKGEPVEFVLQPLTANTHYRYQIHTRPHENAPFQATGEETFVTARPAGTPFTFTIQADSHLDSGTDPEVYKKSLANAVASGPDFHIDLGDTFMTDKYPEFKMAAPQYLAQRYYLGLVGKAAPVFLVLGNHDGEQPGRDGLGPGSMAVWSNMMRKRYFPNPVPDTFYSGNTTADSNAGLLQDYYAWEWGDAQFIVLNPFWYSERQRGRAETVDNWGRTLGSAQYRWLADTLEKSKARYRFVFIHHLVGGETREGRGGAEASHFFEWGGKDIDGTVSFPRRRPGWPLPIHDLLTKHRVSAVFHGHDHLYVRQERNGITYQEVPQPGHSRSDNTNAAHEYGYREGDLLGNSGILRVSVSPSRARVEYVRAYQAEQGGRKTGSVSHAYELAPR